MTVLLTEPREGKVFEVCVSGRLDRAAYKRFAPMAEHKIDEYGKIRILFEMHHFDGWTPAALWEDIKFDIKHFNHIERVAVVGDRKWQRGMAIFCRPFTTAKVRFFEQSEIDQARAWLHE